MDRPFLLVDLKSLKLVEQINDDMILLEHSMLARDARLRSSTVTRLI